MKYLLILFTLISVSFASIYGSTTPDNLKDDHKSIVIEDVCVNGYLHRMVYQGKILVSTFQVFETVRNVPYLESEISIAKRCKIKKEHIEIKKDSKK